jgi:hypothetical protein
MKRIHNFPTTLRFRDPFRGFSEITIMGVCAYCISW